MDLRLPAITAADTAGRLDQLQRYLNSLVEQLNWCLSAGLPAAQGQAAPAAPAEKTPEETFSSIKSLIIKSADIVQRYSQTITQSLEGTYVAKSDFGAYTEQTAQQIRQTSDALERAFTNLQTIESGLDRIESTMVGVSAYLRSGLLYYGADGIPVYGLEVGQQTQTDGQTVFNKYARFTASRLCFYDANDNEVAYISDDRLHIVGAEITGTFRQGHLLDTAQPDGSVVTRYTAG